MNKKTNTENLDDKEFSATQFLKELREFSITVGEDCPEGHRRDPSSGRCLPIGSTDHTAFTRSLNDDQGPEWRGLVDKNDDTFDNQEDISDRSQESESAMDAEDMDEPSSCAEGTTFSFLERRCVSLEEAEKENFDSFAMNEEGSYIKLEEVAKNGHEEIIAKDPEGRKDPVGFDCPPNQFFDFKRRECIPLNKDTVLASEIFSDDFKKEVATFARLAMTNPDPMDGHVHVATLDEEGNGVTSMSFSHGEPHSHTIEEFIVMPFTREINGMEYTSRHPGVAIPREVEIEKMEEFSDNKSENSKELTSKERKSLPDSAFGVPAKRKFPLDTCARVRNAMARFNQAKDLTSSEKASLRRKILARARQCDIEVENFAKANTHEEFSQVMQDLLLPFRNERLSNYKAKNSDNTRGPCPPGMNWDSAAKRCSQLQGFFSNLKKDQANALDIIAKDPVGRRDTPNFICPPKHLFDFKNRKCIPMDTRMPVGQPGDTSKASRDLAPNPKGRPADLPQDCPKGTIWDAKLERCIPLDSKKKTKSSSEENSKTNPNGPGKDKDSKGCAPGEFFNPITKKCMPRKGAFKGKSQEDKPKGAPKDKHGCNILTEKYDGASGKCVPKSSASELAVNQMPGNRQGLTPSPAGIVKHPSDCPMGTIWDGKSKTCRPLDSSDKNRPSGNSPQEPQNTASIEDVVNSMSLAKIISCLDEIIREEIAGGRKEKATVKAKDLPNEAFPPSLVNSAKRSLMHHTANVEDAYDSNTVDCSRLRNSLARISKVTGYSEKAKEEALEHLLAHAKDLIVKNLGKK